MGMYMVFSNSMQLRRPYMLLDPHFQVNHLSQSLLVRTLVVISSDLHRACPFSTVFDSIEDINTDLGALKLCWSKSAQVFFVRAIVRRMETNEPGFQSNKEMGS